MKKITILLSILVALTSCYKEGPRGPMGPPGQNGANGKDGKDGEMPKLYYFDLHLYDFKPQAYNSSWVAYSYIQNYTIQETDLVTAFVYLSSDGNGDNYWQSLPFNEYVDNTDFYIEHSYGIMGMDDDTGNNDYLQGDIMFYLRTNTGVAPYTDMSSAALLKYNVYIIPGKLAKSVKSSVDIHNKKALDEYLKTNKIKYKKIELN